MDKISTQFRKGLAEYNLTIADIQNWRYCGGSGGGRHYNYWLLKGYTKEEMPEHVSKCVCGHDIQENCYIENKEDGEIMILGNCCIKRFMTKSGRTCEVCDEPHKNRLCNRCNACRVGVCDKCSKSCNSTYSVCYTCFK